MPTRPALRREVAVHNIISTFFASVQQAPMQWVLAALCFIAIASFIAVSFGSLARYYKTHKLLGTVLEFLASLRCTTLRRFRKQQKVIENNSKNIAANREIAHSLDKKQLVLRRRIIALEKQNHELVKQLETKHTHFADAQDVRGQLEALADRMAAQEKWQKHAAGRIDFQETMLMMHTWQRKTIANDLINREVTLQSIMGEAR